MPIEFWTLNLNVSFFELEETGLRLHSGNSTLGEAKRSKHNFNENIHTYLKLDKVFGKRTDFDFDDNLSFVSLEELFLLSGNDAQVHLR